MEKPHEQSTEEQTFEVRDPKVVPADVITIHARIQVLDLGYRAGDEVEWQMPGGLRRLRIERVLPPEELRASPARETYARAVG